MKNKRAKHGKNRIVKGGSGTSIVFLFSRARVRALKRESTASAWHSALSKQAKSAAKKRTASSRSAAAKKAARTRASRKR